MPFKSKAQARWMFSQHPEMAKEWKEKTDFHKLPERVKAKKKDKEPKAEAPPPSKPQNDPHQGLDLSSLTHGR